MNETGRRVREPVRRHGRLHRPRLRRLLDPRLRLRPAHPGPAVEATLRVRPRGHPEAPASAGRRQGERGPDRIETGRTSCASRPPWPPGTLRPSQILRKLAAYPRQNELAAALRGGRPRRTLPVHGSNRLDHGPRHATAGPGRIEQGRGAQRPQARHQLPPTRRAAGTEPAKGSTTGSPASTCWPRSSSTGTR